MVVSDEVVMVAKTNSLVTQMVVSITITIVIVVKVNKATRIKVQIEVLMALQATKIRVVTIKETDLEMVAMLIATIRISKKERIILVSNKEKLGKLKVSLRILRK